MDNWVQQIMIPVHNVNSLTTREKIAEFANSIDLDEVAHNEPPHLDLYNVCPLVLNSKYNIAWT